MFLILVLTNPAFLYGKIARHEIHPKRTPHEGALPSPSPDHFVAVHPPSRAVAITRVPSLRCTPIDVRCEGSRPPISIPFHKNDPISGTLAALHRAAELRPKVSEAEKDDGLVRAFAFGGVPLGGFGPKEGSDGPGFGYPDE